MHRRAGKTVLALMAGLETVMTCPLPFPRVAYIAPYRNQAKRIMWHYLTHTIANGVRAGHFDINSQDLSVTFRPNGGMFQLVGGDAPDTLRGQYYDLVICDELADMDPNLWESVITYCLADRRGRALLLGTPRGRMNQLYTLHNSPDPEISHHTYTVNDTGMIHPDELAAMQRKVAMGLLSEAIFSQEMLCDFNVALLGAVYGKEMNRMQVEGRICPIEYDETYPVETSWDLGFADSTAEVFWQYVGNQIRVIDYEEMTLTKLPDVIKTVMGKPWADNYRAHYGPHDLAVREYGSGQSRFDIAMRAGLQFEYAPNWSVDDGIEAVRSLLPRMAISTQRGCGRLIECLFNYKFAFDDTMRAFKTKPAHDFSSHCADAVRYYAVAKDFALVGVRTSERGQERWLF